MRGTALSKHMLVNSQKTVAGAVWRGLGKRSTGSPATGAASFKGRRKFAHEQAAVWVYAFDRRLNVRVLNWLWARGMSACRVL